jgi:hypothetical protein
MVNNEFILPQELIMNSALLNEEICEIDNLEEKISESSDLVESVIENCNSEDELNPDNYGFSMFLDIDPPNQENNIQRVKREIAEYLHSRENNFDTHKQRKSNFKIRKRILLLNVTRRNKRITNKFQNPLIKKSFNGNHLIGLIPNQKEIINFSHNIRKEKIRKVKKEIVRINIKSNQNKKLKETTKHLPFFICNDNKNTLNFTKELRKNRKTWITENEIFKTHTHKRVSSALTFDNESFSLNNKKEKNVVMNV